MKNLANNENPYEPIKVKCKVQDSLQIKPYIIKKDHSRKIGSNIQRYFYDGYPCNYNTTNGYAIFTVFIRGYMNVPVISSIDANTDFYKPPRQGVEVNSKSTKNIIIVVLFTVFSLLVFILIFKSCKTSKTGDSKGLRQDSNMSNPLITSSPTVIIAEKNGRII